MEGGPPIFRQNFTCSALLEDPVGTLPIRGYHPLWHSFPAVSGCSHPNHWPGPRSLVTTNGVSVDVLSSGYLDISVYRVCFAILCIQIEMTLRPGFPIRISPGQRSLSTSPKLFAASHVLHRLYAPRHPPSALSSLTTHNRSRLGLDLRALAMSLRTGRFTPRCTLSDAQSY